MERKSEIIIYKPILYKECNDCEGTRKTLQEILEKCAKKDISDAEISLSCSPMKYSEGKRVVMGDIDSDGYLASGPGNILTCPVQLQKAIEKLGESLVAS